MGFIRAAGLDRAAIGLPGRRRGTRRADPPPAVRPFFPTRGPAKTFMIDPDAPGLGLQFLPPSPTVRVLYGREVDDPMHPGPELPKPNRTVPVLSDLEADDRGCRGTELLHRSSLISLAALAQ